MHNDNDVKIIAIVASTIFLSLVMVLAYLAFSDTQETLKLKECASAGSEWIRNNDSRSMECKRK